MDTIPSLSHIGATRNHMTELTAFVLGRQGREVASRLGIHDVRRYDGPELDKCWESGRTLLLVMAIPAAIRIIAPRLIDKRSDPAVICVDQEAKHVIPLVGSHKGANASCRLIASLLGATPVITTGSDGASIAALDAFVGFEAIGDVAGLISAMINGAMPKVQNPQNHNLPLTLVQGHGPGEILVTTSNSEASRFLDTANPTSLAVVMIPKQFVGGIGCSSDASAEHVSQVLAKACARIDLHPLAIKKIATIESRVQHPAIVGQKYRIQGVSAEVLQEIEVPNSSALVKAHVGTASVCEAAALVAGGQGARLVVTKIKNTHATAAIAKAALHGTLTLCGLGPGSIDLLAPRSAARIMQAQAVLGFSGYLESISQLLGPHQFTESSPIGDEELRVKRAIELAQAGYQVVLLGSGDPGIYALASLSFEIATQTKGYGLDYDIEVIPGITAGLAASSLLGAPLGHDHCYISLSDLLTPFEAIERRIEAAAVADFVVVFYNPRSKERNWQLDRAIEILAKNRPPNTPIGIVKNAYRPGEKVVLTTIDSFDSHAVDMTTVVIVGSCQSFTHHNRFITPRGYRWNQN